MSLPGRFQALLWDVDVRRLDEERYGNYVGMEKRMVLLGGRMGIRSAPGEGTEIHARLPLPV